MKNLEENNVRLKRERPFGLNCSLGDEGYDPMVLEKVEDEPNPPLT